jgi:hypothetical protein
MKKFNEDHTAGVLAGIPVFCVNRVYKTKIPSALHKVQYLFNFENGYSASIVEFVNRKFSSGCQYEIMVGIPGDSDRDVERGDEYDMHDILCEIEVLKT